MFYIFSKQCKKTKKEQEKRFKKKNTQRKPTERMFVQYICTNDNVPHVCMKSGRVVPPGEGRSLDDV